ncbi:MAG: ATP-binding protein [Pseudomonadota bacterium]
MQIDTLVWLKYEKGIADCSKALISGKFNALTNAMERLLTACGAHRISFYLNYTDALGNLCARLTHESVARKEADHYRGRRLSQMVYAGVASGWQETMASDRCVTWPDLDRQIQDPDYVTAYGCVSLLMVPVFSGDHWHGFMGFEDCTTPRVWQEMDVRFLRTAAAMVGSYLEKEYYITALIKSEERYRSIIENINEGYFETDLGGVFTFVNRNLCTMHRRKKSEFIGLGYQDITDPETALLMKKTYATILKTGIPCHFDEYQIVRKDGSVAILEQSVTLIEDAQGEKRGFRGIVRDAGERKKQEAMKKQFHANCFEMQKLESIATLAGGLAHDFNNLLMGIQGNTSLIIAKCQPDPFLRAKIQNIENCISSGAEITRQLLGFARGGKYQVKSLVINSIIYNVLELFGRTRKDIRVFTEFQTDLRPVQGDAGQLEQIFLNLFLNAAQAMPQGGHLRVVTEAWVVDESFAFLHGAAVGDYVRISITDTGVGMDERTLKRIFEPFFTTREMGRGTGLGLASVYGIVKNHSGTITVESEKGKGSTFRLYFPADAAAVTVKASTAPAREIRGREIILLVDDEAMVLDITSELLQELGYSVLPADSGFRALAVYEQHKSDIALVMMDVVMPDMNGFEIARQIMTLNPLVPILFLSGYPADHEKLDHVSFDHDMFLKKPFTMAQLKEKVDSVIGPGSGSRSRQNRPEILS